MAGHVIADYFRKKENFRVFYTSRERKDPNTLYLDVRKYDQVDSVVNAVSPDIIVNCVGLLNQYAEQNEIDAYLVNGLLPHRLADAADRVGAKVIHISSDCVFTGNRGNYTEKDKPDGVTVYARTKCLGEVVRAPHMTIRTSIIGPEIRRGGIGLFEWFMSRSGTIKGYRNVLWNGVTTLELAKAIDYYIERPVSGLIHLTAPKKISKHDLLHLFQRTFDKNNVEIIPDDEIRNDRSLVNTREDAAFSVCGYEQMLQEMRDWMNRR